MHDNPSLGTGRAVTVTGLTRTANDLCARLAYDPMALLARAIVGSVFWWSGRTKVDGFAIKDQTFFLFQHEYALPLIDHRLAAYLATAAEHVLPILLIAGLATRFSALALLLMTATIQIFVYPEAWQTHGLWAVCLLMLVKFGPGRWSLDHAIARRTPSP
ncbi:DoxX family protein [Mesorhizobium sp. CAU 1741]|uniref:DoxX family protein n=1 Tax=Mesorhizobium sp. CAU 1741 TaxID=3140366 RepID=UPI00325AA488